MAHLYIRRDDNSGHHGLGLGWLLAIALGGAVLLFMAIGFLLAWRIKARNQPCTTRVYGTDPDSIPATHRLVKRRALASEYSMSRFSSRLSLTLPPILPPLPTYNSFLGNRRRSRSWVDEDGLHGPKVNKSTRESWFSRDNWFGRVPTLPKLDPEAAESRPEDVEEQQIMVMKRQSRPALTTSKTAPELTPREEVSPSRGRRRVPAQAHVQPSLTDTDLHDILTLTERRLKDGVSRSPTKTPRSSPKKTSPMKTPRSYRTVSSRGNRGGSSTPSPSKRPQTATPRTGSRNASVSSIGSAANSLIAEATQQLELPGGLSSPSRLRGTEWEAPKEKKEDKPEEPLVLKKRRSHDSDVSSTLSTLYSVGEPEENRGEEERKEDKTDSDPFTESGASIPVPARNPLRRHTQSISMANLARRNGESPVPAPLRPMSSQPAMGRDDLKMDAWRMPIVLHPPSRPQSEDVGAKNSLPVMGQIPSTLSETTMVTDVSMVTDTVHSDSDSELPTMTLSRPGHEDGSPTPTPSTPTVDLSSSPYNEQDILSLLLSSSQPKRALPLPPRTDTGEHGTALSPRPKSTKHSRKTSTTSVASSNYSDPATVSTGSPSRAQSVSRANSTKEKDTQEVGSTIAQLRRMNSMVSSYSVASVASTVTIVGADADSPSLPAFPSGNLSPTRSNTSKPGTKAIGSRHYLNIGGGRKTKKQRSAHLQPGAAQDHGKENVGLGLRVSRGGEGLREGRRSGNLGRDTAKPAKLGPVEELIAEDRRREEQRGSVDSLGLYDTDGFLIGSPDREAKRRSLRM